MRNKSFEVRSCFHKCGREEMSQGLQSLFCTLLTDISENPRITRKQIMLLNREYLALNSNKLENSLSQDEIMAYIMAQVFVCLYFHLAFKLLHATCGIKLVQNNWQTLWTVISWYIFTSFSACIHSAKQPQPTVDSSLISWRFLHETDTCFFSL